MSSPRFSVIIPTFQRMPELREALDSVLAQTEQSWECHIINDYPEDSGRLEVFLSGMRDPRIRIHSMRKSSGVSSARNYGASLAVGEILAFLDDDDIWSPDYLEQISKAYKLHPESGAIRSRCVEFKTNGHSIEPGASSEGPSEWPRNSLIRHYVELNPWPFMTSSCCSVPRAIFEQSGGYNPALKSLEDVDFVLRLNSTHPVNTCLTTTVYYRRNAGTSLSKDWTLVETELFKLCAIHHLEEALPGRLRILYQRSHLTDLSFAILQKDRTQIYKILRHYLSEHPLRVRPGPLFRMIAALAWPGLNRQKIRAWKKTPENAVPLPSCLLKIKP